MHGDLKPGNVLLKTHKVDRRGYIAKVGTCLPVCLACMLPIRQVRSWPVNP